MYAKAKVQRVCGEPFARAVPATPLQGQEHIDRRPESCRKGRRRRDTPVHTVPRWQLTATISALISWAASRAGGNCSASSSAVSVAGGGDGFGGASTAAADDSAGDDVGSVMAGAVTTCAAASRAASVTASASASAIAARGDRPKARALPRNLARSHPFLCKRCTDPRLQDDGAPCLGGGWCQFAEEGSAVGGTGSAGGISNAERGVASSSGLSRLRVAFQCLGASSR